MDRVQQVFTDAPSDTNIFDADGALPPRTYWHQNRKNLALLVEFLATQGDTPAELRQAILNPASHADDFLMAESWDRDRNRR